MKLATFVLSFFLTSVFYSFANAAVSQWTDFTLDNGHVFFPVNIEGIPTRVMLDSGAQINSINKAFIGKHQLELNRGSKVNVKGVYDVETRNAYNNVAVEIFGLPIELDGLVEGNLGHHSNGMLLGAGFFPTLLCS